MRRLGLYEEMAKAIYLLCTEQSSYINGAEFYIYGGQYVLPFLGNRPLLNKPLPLSPQHGPALPGRRRQNLCGFA